MSTGWIRFPAAKTPSALVHERRVNDGTSVTAVHLDPAESCQLDVGHPVAGEDHDVRGGDPAHARHQVLDLDRLYPVVADDAHDGGASWPPGTASATAPAAVRAAYDSARACRVVIRTVRHPACLSVRTADQLTSSAPTTTAVPLSLRPCA